MPINKGEFDLVDKNLWLLQHAFVSAVPLEIVIVRFENFFAPAVKYHGLDILNALQVTINLEVIVFAVAVRRKCVGDENGVVGHHVNGYGIGGAATGLVFDAYFILRCCVGFGNRVGAIGAGKRCRRCPDMAGNAAGIASNGITQLGVLPQVNSYRWACIDGEIIHVIKRVCLVGLAAFGIGNGNGIATGAKVHNTIAHRTG